MALNLATPCFSQEQQSLSTREIGGETYIKLKDAQSVFDFSYQKNSNESIVIHNQQRDWIKNVAVNVNPSVVAIIGEDRKLNPDLINDYYYSKIPAGLMHGSGVIVSQDGRIITNNHVVEPMKTIYVVLSNKKAYEATLLYRNKDIDLALIKINAAGLKPIQFEDTKNITVGDEVIAIGTPLYFGWSNSVTKGIISGLNRPVDETYTYLQTDASINPGNSGGPLINRSGNLVGINTLGIEFFQGVNFSIPVDNVQYFLNQYNKYGKIHRTYTGIEFEESWLSLMGIPSNQGLKVITLKDDCIVDKSKLQEGDILESINGASITSIASYNEILKGQLPGQEVKLTFSRNDKSFTIKAILKECLEQDKSK
jgi:2-alkenal reductase